MNIKSSVPRVGLLISILILPTLLLALAGGSLAAPNAPVTARVSIPSGGGQANGASILPSLSADGTLVVFTSSAYNLVAGDNNGYADIFLHNRSNSMTERISLTSSGGASDGDSQTAVISPDGRYVAFASTASNLVASDFNFASDIFLRDRQNSQTRRVSVLSNGAQADGRSISPAVSSGGRYVAFQSLATNLVSGDTNSSDDIFLHDTQSGQTLRLSVSSSGAQANGSSMLPSLSASGRLAAFRSLASNLVGGDTNDHADIFVRDLDAGLTTRVSIASSGDQANGNSISAVISADGRYVAFISEASNLVSGDTNGFRDVFVHDRQTGTTERVSVSSAGAQANDTTNTLLGISADGRQVAFASWADNLVGEDTNGYYDVFVHDRWSGVTEIVSVNNALQAGDRESYHPAISADGRFIAFNSYATNLVSGDTNGAFDVFVRDREAQPQPSLTSDYTSGTPGSFFNVQGANFPRNSLATISANGLVLTSTLPVDSSGFFSFTLDTTAADPGYYAINAATNPQAFAFITLDPAGETHPLTGAAALLSVPGGVAFPYWSYLAILQK